MKAFRFFQGFILGALVGAVVGLLFAPYPGEQLTQRLQQEIERLRREAAQAAAARRAELEERLATLRTTGKLTLE